MIDWNDNAMRAIHKFYEYLDEQGMYYADKEGCIREFFDWLPQTKTVADAVKWANGKWKGEGQFIVYHEELGKFAFVVSDGPYENGWYLVCTRAEFEAYVKEQESSQTSCSEGEKWTHTYIHSQPCRVEVEKPDEHGYIVIYVQRDGYIACLPDDIEPIKPQITKEAIEVLEDFKSYATHNNGIGVNNLVALYLKDRFNIVPENKRGD